MTYRSSILVALMAILPGIGLGDTIVVPDDYSCIQDAIDAASAGDKILVRSGTYTGECNKNLSFHPDTPITVCSENGPDYCAIDCEHDGRGFRFADFASRDYKVVGFTIRNGDPSDHGGGILCSGAASPTIENCVIEDCFVWQSGGGGGLFCDGQGSPRIIGTRFRSNEAWSGGGVCAVHGGNPVVEFCVFEDNHARSRGGGVTFGDATGGSIIECRFQGNTSGEAGGAVSCHQQSAVTILGSTFVQNTAGTSGPPIQAGGAIYNWKCDTRIRQCYFEGNATANGAAIMNDDNANVQVVSCQFIRNSATNDAGAIENSSGSSPLIVNCLFAENRCVADGGAMRSILGANPEIVNCTFAGNTASRNSGGIWSQEGSVPIVRNSVFWNNTDQSGAGELAQIDGDGPRDVRCSCIMGCSLYCQNPADKNTGDDPLFGEGYRLLSNSPLIDAGCNDALPPDEFDLDGDGNVTEPLPVDLDGYLRVVDGDGDCLPEVDMGAYEVHAEPDCDGDGVPDDCDPDPCCPSASCADVYRFKVKHRCQGGLCTIRATALMFEPVEDKCFTFCLDPGTENEDCQDMLTNRRGRAKATWRVLDCGEHDVCLYGSDGLCACRNFICTG